MAITYKAGNRIVLHSDYQDNFSTYADQTAGNTAWEVASNVAGRRVNVTKQNLELENDSGTTNYAVVHDLGASVVNTTEWTLRFSADVTLNSGSNNWCFIGLFGSDESVGGGTNQNAIAVAFQNDGVNTKFWLVAGVDHTPNSGGWDYFNATGNGTLTSTKYYIQLSRLTDTSIEVKIYLDSTYETLHVSMTASGSSLSLGDLRYIKFVNNTTSGSGSIDIVMDDVKFYNGTMAKPTADGTNENGSTFIETDTGKEHILNYGAWAETNQPSDCLAELLSDHSQQKMRCWDFFGGQDIVTTNGWNWTAGAGGVVVSQGMADEIDGGYQIIMTNGHVGTYDFNNKRQYNHNGAVIIGVCKRSATNGIFGIGFKGDKANVGSYVDSRTTRLAIRHGTNTIQGMTADSSGATYHDTGVTSDANWHTLKIELTSGATHFSVDGVLRDSSTGSENETSEQVQPMIYAHANGSGAGGNIRYLEAYNT